MSGLLARAPVGRGLSRALAPTVALLAACTAPPDQPGMTAEGAREIDPVDAIFAEHAGAAGPGCAFGVARNGRLILAKGYGLASLEDRRPNSIFTAFNIGSIGKQFTAMAVLLLESQGALATSDDLRRWVPELPDYGTPIHLQDLLQHTSGLRDHGTLARLAGRPIQTMEDFLGLMTAQRDLNFLPGSRHEYSHSDYVMLGAVVERAAGMSLGTYLQRHVFAPLDMRWSWVHDGEARPRGNRALAHAEADSGYRVRFPRHTMVGDDNVYTTVQDLLKWELNFHRPVVGGQALVDRLLSRPLLANGDTIPYAYGLQRGEFRGVPTIFRGGGGGGFATEFVRFPGQGLAVATLCNVTPSHPRYLARDVAARFLRRQLGPELPDSAADTVATVPADLDRLAGVYGEPTESWNLVRFEVRDGALHEVLADEAYRLSRLRSGLFQAEGVFYRFEETAGAAAGAVSLTTETGTNERLVRLPASAAWVPGAADLASFAGRWFSVELNTAWEVRMEGQDLVLTLAGEPRRLSPMQRDGFIAMIGGDDEFLMLGLSFERDARGSPVAFRVSLEPAYEAVRNLRFERMATR